MNAKKGYGLIIPVDFEVAQWEKETAQNILDQLRRLTNNAFYRMAEEVGIDLGLLEQAGYEYSGLSELSMIELEACLSETTYKELYDEWKKIPNKERNSDEPRCPCIVLDDCTDERRSEILFINNDPEAEVSDCSGTYGSKRGAIVIYPEIKGMFDSKNRNNNGGTTGVSKLLRLFDCEDIKVDRRNGFTMLIKDPFCNIIGDLQIGMLKPTFGN